MKTKILVVTHKQAELPIKEEYVPIIVGQNKEIEIPRALRDTGGDSIADKNDKYCELTAHYWYWKNRTDNDEIIGLCHYRRYFTKRLFSVKLKDVLSSKDIAKIMSKYDIILAEAVYFDCTVYNHYFKEGCGREKDLIHLRKTIMDYHPEYIAAFDKIMNRNYGSFYNMFIMSVDKFERYSKWLFSILDIMESEIDLTGYSKEEARVFGYLSEILLNVWVEHNKLRKKRMPVMRVGFNNENYLIYNLWRIYHSYKNKILYSIRNCK